MASAEAVAAVVEAGGAHVPELMGRLEERLPGRWRARTARCWPGTPAPRSPPAASACARCWSCVAAGPPPRDPEAVLRAAVAVELVHSATLVHDDVLDAAPLRRGRPTVVASAGREMAIATGDLLFSRAFAELAATGSAEAVRVLSRRVSSALARGRAAPARGRVEPRRRARALPGALRPQDRAAVRGRVPARRARGRRPRRSRSARFGRAIGLAFQLLDDVLDVAGPAERTGKHRGTDLLDGTVTLPLILARERDAALAALDLRAVRTPEQAEAVCDAIAATGALEAARAEALAMVGEAKAGLPALPEAQQGALELVADGVVDRYA